MVKSNSEKGLMRESRTGLQVLIWDLRDGQTFPQENSEVSCWCCLLNQYVEETAELWSELWGALREEAK